MDLATSVVSREFPISNSARFCESPGFWSRLAFSGKQRTPPPVQGKLMRESSSAMPVADWKPASSSCWANPMKPSLRARFANFTEPKVENRFFSGKIQIP